MTLEGWNYRKSHVITHTSITDYQTRIRVYRTTGTDSGDTVYVGDKCRADFGDIRFTNSAGTELPYWMEVNATTYADFWVKLDSITTSATFYIYYGNSSATTTSNGDTTFVFFDDFTGSSLDTGKWTASSFADGTGSVSLSSGICTITHVTDHGYQIYTNTTFGTNLTIRARVNVPNAAKNAFFGFSNASNYSVVFYANYPTSGQFGIVNRNPYPTETKTAIGSSYTGYKTFEIARNSTTSTLFSVNNSNVGTLSTNIPTTALPITFTAQGQTIYVDWILLRTYATTEPTHSTWGAEQDLSATSFTIRITPTTGTDPLSVTYNCIIPEGTLTNFTLSYGDGNEYTTASQSSFATTHVYNEPGTYTVWGEGYTEFATHVYYEIPYGVTVTAPSVVASFTISQSYNTVTFTNTSTGNINECYWDFGDGLHSYETNPVHTYYSPATYNVTLYVSNQYQYSSVTSNVTITQILTPPSAYFTPARLDVINPTLPYNVTFTNLSTPTFGCTYNWTVDGGTVSTSSDPTISFATHGVYDIGLTVTNSLGSSTRTYTDAIRLTRKSRTMNEVVGSADTFATFGCHVFVEYPSGSDLPLVYATILPEGVYFIQREIPDVPGIDEWGVRHLYSTINEWGVRIFTALNSWGHKILHNSSSVDRTPLRCIDVEIFEETVIVSDDHQFDEDPS